MISAGGALYVELSHRYLKLMNNQLIENIFEGLTPRAATCGANIAAGYTIEEVPIC